MWPTGFCPTAGVKTLQKSKKKATTARPAGRAEPMTAKEGSRRIKACVAFRNRTASLLHSKRYKPPLSIVAPRLRKICRSSSRAASTSNRNSNGPGQDKTGELIAQSTETVIADTSTVSEIREKVGKKIEQAIARGIRFTIITEPGQKIPEGASVVNRKGLIATDVIVDGSAALI